MFNRLILTASLILSAVLNGNAQHSCGTDNHYHKLLEKYPQLAEYEQQFKTQLNGGLARTTGAASDTTVYDVPLVLHVVHDYGAENLSDDVLYDAAAYWATVYMEQNADTATVIPPFIPYIGNPRMRLHLATKDPNGNPTKGVIRHNSYLTNNADDQAKYQQWPQNKYINIWFIGTFGASATGAAAYAIYPSTATYEPYYDGVISLASYANYAKVIPHELGHVLNLKHTWGDTNNPTVACGDDAVDDTPPTKGHSPTGCTIGSLYDTTCATGYLKHYTAVGGADSVVDYPDTANSENIMDYTYCQKMFTKGQCVRMREALTSSVAGRNNLITAANLAATGALAPMPDLPPVADFIVNRAAGGGILTDSRTYFMTFNSSNSFVFRNTSWNDTISSVAWAFSNGASTATSSSMTTVNNQFSVPGWVTVSLTATSNAGSTTIVNPNAVYVADTTAVSVDGYSQPFAAAGDISNWPMFNFYNNQFQWQFYTGAGMDDNTCIRYRSYDSSSRRFGTAAGDHDDFYTPAFNLQGVPSKFYLNFYTTGASTSHGISSWSDRVDDSLEIDASTNGGTKWTKIAAYKGSQLYNSGSKNTEFIPAAGSDWVGRAVSIPSSSHGSNTFFRFRFWPGNTGNNLYLDNLYFYPFPVGVKEALKTAANSFNIFPNPASSGCTMVFKTGNDGLVNYCIRDITGKLVYEAKKTFAANSVEQEALPRSVTPSAGMYFVTVSIDGMNTTQKLVVY